MASSSPESLLRKVNRSTRDARARWSWIEDAPLGPALSARRYRLGNGLELFLVVDPSAPVVSSQTWFRVGSRHEQPGKTGLAHFFEHLMFKETKNHGPGEFDRLVESVGGETNAATWTDWTAYYENVPRSEVALVIRLEADRMANLVLQGPQVESEREVVINERRYRVEDDVEGAVNEKLYATAFRKHPYRWPTIGWMRDIERYTVDDCLRFYRTYYAPNNAVLIMVGDVDEQEILSLVQQHYGVLEASRLPLEKRVVEPAQRRERVLVEDKPTDTEKVAVGWRGPAFGTHEHAALTVLDDILTGGRSSRLYQRLINDAELASEVHGSLAPFRDPGLYELWLNARPRKKSQILLDVVDEELGRLGRELPTEQELDKAKNRLELSFLHGLETVTGKADQVGFFAVVTGDAGGVFRQLEEYRSVTAEQVRDAARTFLARERRTVIHVRPQRGRA